MSRTVSESQVDQEALLWNVRHVSALTRSKFDRGLDFRLLELLGHNYALHWVRSTWQQKNQYWL
jgi:hypothetical protein